MKNAASNDRPAGPDDRPGAKQGVSEDAFRRLVEQIPDYAIFMLDPSGRIASWNEGAARIKGYARDEIIGEHFSRFYPAEDIAARKPERELEIAAATGRFIEEGTRLRKDGSSFWASVIITALHDEQGELCGYSKITRDITSSKFAEDRSSLMVKLALNAMLLVDENGIISQLNQQCEKLFGYSEEELVGQPIELLVPDRFRAEHPKNRQRYFRDSEVRPMGAGRDLFARRRDGSEFPVEISLHPIDTEHGTQVLASVVDITERRRAAEQARQHLNELAHVARLSTMGQMVSELAHEMNQPLAAAANYARACVNFTSTGPGVSIEQLVEWMRKAAVQIDRTLQIVNRLAAFVKNEPARRTIININRVIENIVELSVLGVPVEAGSPRVIKPTIQFDESLPDIAADRIQIEQVLLNLIRNAIDAMHDNPPERTRLTIRTSFDDGSVRVEVSDSGQGIAPEQISRLFGPFFTTKAHGMGLGLSISRSIVENHGGRIDVVSSVGEGTTFSFTLPIPEGVASP